MISNRKIVVVIPTRNRAELAISAVKSVLNQENCTADIVVSDNSTENEEVIKLEEFCRGLDSSSVHYIRPDEPLPMPEHWRWALDKAYGLSDANYIMYLTDRMVLVPHALRDISAIIERYPEKVISYSWDLIRDIDVPVISFQVIRTGKLYELTSRDLLDRASESIFNYSLPRMMNSCCSRKTIERVKEKYGSIFFSDNPDFNFAYTCLDVEDSILFYDYPLLISYGLGVSNGTTSLRGLFNKTATTQDFIKTSKYEGINDFVDRLPFSVTRAIAFEYDLVKDLSGSDKFKKLDEDRLLRRVLSYIIFYEDSQEKMKGFRAIYALNKIKFPVHLAHTYFSSYKQRGTIKIKSKMGAHDAFDIMKHHRTLEEAMSEIIDNPRPSTTGRKFFETRIGRFPRELDVTFQTSSDDAR